MRRVHIHITGIVQGVGMRPFVYREATAHGIGGWVLNAGDGVHIEANGEPASLEAFIRDLQAHAPAASRIDAVEVSELATDEGPGQPTESTCPHGARIAQSNETGDATGADHVHKTGPGVAHDVATAQGGVRNDTHGAAGRDPHRSAAALGNADPHPVFRIVASKDSAAHTTLVSPDIATCGDCLCELFDPADRRYHYPFINCTNCGPRFTIIRDLPYDRARTSMDAFPLCNACAAEYADPLDRRFHAQPDACFDCGPHLTWQEGPAARRTATGCEGMQGRAMAETGRNDTWNATETTGRSIQGAAPAIGTTRAASDAIIARCAELLEAGGIVAIKGLGGFHLACRADAETAVAELRQRKHRSRKPLAIMVRDLDIASALCHLNDTERELLQGSVRPIVLVRLRAGAPSGAAIAAADSDPDSPATPAAAPRLAPSVTCGLPNVGLMLPYTPPQHLLMAACAERGVHTLVMTSGNISGSPIETDDAHAWGALVESGIADALLGNDRPILTRYDDSVAMVSNTTARPVRRARGYAPRPLDLPGCAPLAPDPAPADGACCILACGPEQKSTLAYTRERADGSAACFVSQHIGDLENAQTLDAWHEARTRLAILFDLHPSALACDAHPGYRSSQWARAEARRTRLPLIEVQHHHAHIASVIADAAARGNHDPAQPVVGIALDGTGAGATFDAEGNLQLDGTVWGGEVLVASLTGMQRAAHLRCWRLPGGVASIRDPRRCAWSLLASYHLLDHPGAADLADALSPEERALTETMVERGLNSPLTSSAGRLFDAVAALLGICHRATYDGEPAIALEAAALRAQQYQDARGPEGAADAAAAEGPLEFETPPRPSAPAASTHREHPSAESGSPLACGYVLTGCTIANPIQPAAAPAEISVEPLLTHLLDGLARNVDPAVLALDTHRLFAQLMAHAAIDAAREHGISSVALSGGVFTNRLLLRDTTRILERHGLTVLTPRTVPFNDGCIAYGQAAIARACIFAAKRPSQVHEACGRG